MAKIAPVTHDWDGSEVTTRGVAPLRAIRKRRTWGAGGGGGGDTDPPGMTWAVDADGAAIVGTADEACKTDAGHTPAAARFALGGTHATIASTSWDDSTHFRLTFTSGARVTDFETPTVSYTAAANPIEDVAGNALLDIVNAATTNPSTFLAGAILLMNMYRAASYVLSGSDITSIVNEATGTSHNTTANPQYSATGLNSRPSADFDGTTQAIRGTDAAVRACMVEQAAHHVFAIAATDNDDAIQFLFAVCSPGVSNPRRGVGITNANSGRHRDLCVNDAIATTTVDGVDAAPTTSPVVYEYYGSTTTTCAISGVIDGPTPGSDFNARAWNPGATTTPAEWVIASSGTSGGLSSFWNGRVAFLVVFPSVLSAADALEVREYLYFLSGLTGS